ncbi:MAG: hypothetical protein KJ645_11315 [Planctomycetes bacterium]|nr:hypothetical protein [Planctomycetota bacterium]
MQKVIKARDHLVEELLKIRAHLPVRLCTGFKARLTEERFQKMGIRKFLMEPIAKRMLAESVSNILMEKTVGISRS